LAGAGPPDPSPVHPPALQLFDLALVDLLQIVLTSAIVVVGLFWTAPIVNL
jgi:hypothetical protein